MNRFGDTITLQISHSKTNGRVIIIFRNETVEHVYTWTDADDSIIKNLIHCYRPDIIKEV